LWPPHGVTVAVKDLCWTKDYPTAAGMVVHQDYRPHADATVVRRLKGAGAVLLGKLQLTEGAYSDHHPSATPPTNPWNGDYWPGISSSGPGVATAAGRCYGAIASDTGGSIRWPSAANGVTGLKPTRGRVSRYGVFELAATLDHVGPIARSAADAAAILTVIAGSDPNDPTALLDPVPDYMAVVEKACAACASASMPRGTATWTQRRRPCSRTLPRCSAARCQHHRRDISRCDAGDR
jgi:amidase